METTVGAKNGKVEVRTQRRSDERWGSEFRYVPSRGKPSEWMQVNQPEGFVSVGMALSAAILMGRHAAEEIVAAQHK